MKAACIRNSLLISMPMWIGLAACTLLLVACAPTGPKLETSIAPKVVTVEVSKPCVPADLPGAPAHYPDEAITAATPDDEALKAVAASNQLRKGRLLTVEPVLAACRK